MFKMIPSNSDSTYTFRIIEKNDEIVGFITLTILDDITLEID